jgi:ankyrin repeat protein
MEVININNKIYEFVKKKEYDTFFNFIKENDNINLDIPDNNYNYLMDYLILDDQLDIIEYLLKNNKIRLDYLDNDNKSILFNPIKLNKNLILDLIVKYDKKNIGVSILDKKDSTGYNCLFYCIIYNNFEAFKFLYENNADIYVTDNNNNNLFFFTLKYEKNSILLYLLDKEIKKNSTILELSNNNINESILQNSIIYDNNEVINYILNLNLNEKYLNNQEKEYGLTALHNALILKKNDVSKKLITKNIDMNIQDYLGNSPFHYAIIENNLEMISFFTNNENLNYNLTNLDGNLPIHFFINDENINVYLFEENTRQNEIYIKILLKIIKKSKLNVQNNLGITPLHLIFKKELWKNKKIKEILSNKTLNVFINDNTDENVLDIVGNNDDFINLITDSFYNKLKLTKRNLNTDWEKYCSTNNLKDLAKLLKKKGDKSIDFYCKEKIKNVILNEKRSLPLYDNFNLEIEEGIFKKGCYYTGSTIDILFGLVYLFKIYPNIKFVLEYPLVENNNLTDYYKKLGINYNYKLDFSNIEIVWVYQKIIYPVNFDSILNNKIDNLNHQNEFIIIPLGIEVENGSHANMLIIDIKKQLIERFEPYGFYGPREFYYNDNLLDELLSSKFKDLLPKYIYVKPSEYLPIISFQVLESLETKMCKKIGDPNGFCAVWCVWWTFYKLRYKNIKSKKLCKLLINKIKFNKLNFKDIIRNFSQTITEIRDKYLDKYELDINKWMNDDYDNDILSKLEKDVLEFIR